MEPITNDPIVALRFQSEAAKNAASAPTDELGRDEFLKLLVTKLANQDPLSPSADTDFVEQLATFSSLEQLIDANSGLDTLAAGQTELVNSQVLTLIGKEALVEGGGQVRIKNGVVDDMVYAVPSPAESVTMTIKNSNGETVRVLDLENEPNGRVNLDWDGTDSDGNVLEDGDYTVDVNAMSASGEPMAIALFRSLPIDGVNFGEGGITLVSGDRILPFEAILEIRADKEA